ncbi:hypothetical protein C8Q76DRAFT_582225, partial [Earliella scabrosa]
ETEFLGLPSEFEPDSIAACELSELAAFEYKLRVGRAFDLLASVRESVRKRAALISEKDRHARGQRDNKRSAEVVTQVHADTMELA